MKKMLIVALVVFGASSTAYADGFVCQAGNGALTVKVYNRTTDGTRTGAVMILSDPEASAGGKTIARFTDAEGTLSSNGTNYVGNVDPSLKDQQNQDTLVGGKVELEDLSTIELRVDFNYNDPVPAGATVSGTIDLNSHDGSVTTLDATCERYLKK